VAALCLAPSLLAVSACSDDEGAPILDVGEGAVGVCLQFDDSVGAEVSGLPEVPCEDEHSHEIFAVVVSQASVYPGFEALETTAQAECLGEFEGYVGISAFDSDLFYSWLVPTLTSWDREDDREIICLVGAKDSKPLVGSVKRSNR
jgi:hypothetical protein